ncbi:hypothetical protein D3C81_1114740 [compost metagenome]
MPTPVSVTCQASTLDSPSRCTSRTRSTTRPCSVNLMALLSRLPSTWRIRSASPSTRVGNRGSVQTSTCRPLRVAAAAKLRSTLSVSSRGENDAGSRLSWPDSILDTSSTSLISCNSTDEELSMVRRYCDWRASKGVRPSSSSVPSTPYSGVRISWLMVARNALLAWLAASAACRAEDSAACAWRWREMSWNTHSSTSSSW